MRTPYGFQRTCFLSICSLYLRLLRAVMQRHLQLVDDGVPLPQEAALGLTTSLLLLLEAPPSLTHLLQLQTLPSHQHLQTLTHTHTECQEQQKKS